MERPLNPKLHLICGMCGCSTMLKFKVVKEIDDDSKGFTNIVYISCKNCGTLTRLDEHIEPK